MVHRKPMLGPGYPEPFVIAELMPLTAALK